MIHFCSLLKHVLVHVGHFLTSFGSNLSLFGVNVTSTVWVMAVPLAKTVYFVNVQYIRDLSKDR